MNKKKIILLGVIGIAGYFGYRYLKGKEEKSIVEAETVVPKLSVAERTSVLEAKILSTFTIYERASINMRVNNIMANPNNELTALEAKEKVVAEFYKK